MLVAFTVAVICWLLDASGTNGHEKRALIHSAK